MYLNERQSPNDGLEQFLRPAQELISSGYAAVGLLEDFNSTLRLFTSALQIPNLDWVALYEEVGSDNVHTAKNSEMSEALRLAWSDPSNRAVKWQA